MAKYRWKTTPYRHQVAAVKSALRGLYETGGYALLMEPRTGKTKTAIDISAIMHQKGDVQRVLIVCPINVMDVWIREIKHHFPFSCQIRVWDKSGRKKLALPPWSDRMQFVIVNYDAFSTPGRIESRGKDGIIRSEKHGGRYDLKRDIRKWKPHLMILDESHRIKTPSSKKTRTIWQIAWQERRKGPDEPLVPYRLILTGTVLTKAKRIFDIYSQWKFVNRFSPLVEGKNLEEFKSEYAFFISHNRHSVWRRNKPGAEERLRRMLHAESFAIARAECFDLPAELDPVLIPVPLEGSAKYYDQMAAEMVAYMDDGEFTWAKIPLVLRTRLAQLTSGIAKTEPTDAYPKGRIVRVGREKLNMLEDIFIDQFEAEEHLVVGALWRQDIADIVKLASRMGVPCFELHGGVDRVSRTQGIARFNEHRGAALMVAQPAAASEGIDLRSAATMIWYSLTDSWVHYRQFKDRIALSPRAVRYMYLLGEGTIDEVKYQSLQEDQDVADRITKSPHILLRDFKNAKLYA